MPQGGLTIYLAQIAEPYALVIDIAIGVMGSLSSTSSNS